MTSSPSVTADALAAKLTSAGILTELQLISVLGDARHNLTLNRLEPALVRHNILSADRLADLKGEVAGVTSYRPGQVRVSTGLPAAVVKKHGVLLTETTDAAGQQLVLFVEDTTTNLDAVSAAYPGPFTVGLVTVPHFIEMYRAAYENKVNESHPRARDLFDVLDAAGEIGSTDIHLSVGIPPRVRADGYLKTLDFQPLDRAWMTDQVNILVEDRHRVDLTRKFSTDLAYSYGPARFRVNIAHDTFGPTMALRQLPSKIPSPKDINLPEAVRQFADLERGMVLVTGPTGSGKSTTLAAVLYEIVTGSSRHVITLEDPIEFRLPTDSASHVNQRELGSSFASFADGLRDALRQDPDVILVGELRDSETVRTAIEAAETGHMVLGTLHTYDAPSTVMRLVNTFPHAEQDAVRAQLSQLLRGIVSQTLVPRLAGKGRVAAFELLVNTPAVSTNLRKHDGHNQLKQTMQTGAADGMQTMEMALARLVHTGVISAHEGRFRARNLDEFQRNLDHLKQQPGL